MSGQPLPKMQNMASLEKLRAVLEEATIVAIAGGFVDLAIRTEEMLQRVGRTIEKLEGQEPPPMARDIIELIEISSFDGQKFRVLSLADTNAREIFTEFSAAAGDPFQQMVVLHENIARVAQRTGFYRAATVARRRLKAMREAKSVGRGWPELDRFKFPWAFFDPPSTRGVKSDE